MAEGRAFRHRLGPDPRTEFLERQRQPGQVLLACLRGQVDVPCCWYRGLLCYSGKGADDDAAHPVPVKRR